VKKVHQTIIDTVRGDCERACVATILALPIEDVPNFSERLRWIVPHMLRAVA